MAKAKTRHLRGAVLALAQVQAVHFHDKVVKAEVPVRWLKAQSRASVHDLDDWGIRVKVEGDTYDFGLYRGGDVETCVDVLEQWRCEAIAGVETGGSSVASLARACGVTRQSIYKLSWGGSSPEHYFVLRGRSPALLWHGRPLQGEYERCLPDLEAWNVVGSLA